MRIVFIADARSPIAQNWIRYFITIGHEVHVISSFPCDSYVLPCASLRVVPVAFSGVAGAKNVQQKQGRSKACLSKWLRTDTVVSFAYTVRRWVGPLDVYRHVTYTRRLVDKINPDLIHAMRIPFEGILAAETLRSSRIPLLISVWGNDFTLHAQQSPLVGYMTQRAMKRADALHPDCQRDLRLARAWGFDGRKPAVVLPGNGGIQTDLFQPGPANARSTKQWAIPEGSPVVLNPRGVRSYVRNDTFFRSIPLVLAQQPKATFLGVAMQGSTVAEQSIQRLQIGHAVRLLPPVPRNEMADLFRLADVIVSPSEHDGTPNTLLEGMACGAFPVVGDIESIREWIEDGVNGLLCDPASPESLARAILRVLDDEDLRHRAAVQNRALIVERADYHKVMARAEEFYKQIISRVHPCAQ